MNPFPFLGVFACIFAVLKLRLLCQLSGYQGVYLHLCASFSVTFQDVGVLSQPAERELLSSEDSSCAEASESHQPRAK